MASALADVLVRDFSPWLQLVQQRRMWPTRSTRARQLAAQNRLTNPLLDATRPPRLPAVAAGEPVPAVAAYAVGIGARPEQVPRRRRRWLDAVLSCRA